MFKGNKFLAIIPARGGSKGIPRKNIFKVNDKPLIQYTIEEAINSKYLDRIVVSTDDQEIAEVSKSVGADIPFLRPEELADDKTKTIDVLIHTVSELKKEGYGYDYVVLLQPTQPLRKGWHIDEAISKIVEKDQESLVSVCEVKEHPILMRTIETSDRLVNLLKINSTIRRQDFPIFYKVNGAIYINKINENFTKETSLNDNKLAYVMGKEYDLDIDEPIDIEVFRIILKSNNNNINN